jgi:hypothetical protein
MNFASSGASSCRAACSRFRHLRRILKVFGAAIPESDNTRLAHWRYLWEADQASAGIKALPTSIESPTGKADGAQHINLHESVFKVHHLLIPPDYLCRNFDRGEKRSRSPILNHLTVG